MTIVEFLEARLAEDEARFEQAVEAETELYRKDGMPDATTQETRDYWLRVPVETAWPRYLAEITAKRALIARYEAWNMGADDGSTVTAILLGVVQTLASVYS